MNCSDCEKDFELPVRSSRWEGTPCPHCGSKELAKKLSVSAASVGLVNLCRAILRH
jgi:putative FmdB family regulatory protein